MSFGQGFVFYPEDREYLTEGDYDATIVKVQQSQHIKDAIDVYVSIAGHKDAFPNNMTLFPRPVLNTYKKDGSIYTNEDVVAWDKAMSRFFKAFQITPGDFNFSNWIGRKGIVSCKKNKNNQYYSLYVAFNQNQNNSTKTSQSQAQQQMQNTQQAQFQFQQGQQNQQDGDIPF